MHFIEATCGTKNRHHGVCQGRPRTAGSSTLLSPLLSCVVNPRPPEWKLLGPAHASWPLLLRADRQGAALCHTGPFKVLWKARGSWALDGQTWDVVERLCARGRPRTDHRLHHAPVLLPTCWLEGRPAALTAMRASPSSLCLSLAAAGREAGGGLCSQRGSTLAKGHLDLVIPKWLGLGVWGREEELPTPPPPSQPALWGLHRVDWTGPPRAQKGRL